MHCFDGYFWGLFLISGPFDLLKELMYHYTFLIWVDEFSRSSQKRENMGKTHKCQKQNFKEDRIWLWWWCRCILRRAGNAWANQINKLVLQQSFNQSKRNYFFNLGQVIIWTPFQIDIITYLTANPIKYSWVGCGAFLTNQGLWQGFLSSSWPFRRI